MLILLRIYEVSVQGLGCYTSWVDRSVRSAFAILSGLTSDYSRV